MQKKSKDLVHQIKKDNQGNALIIMRSGNVFLKLKSRKRRIGWIDRDKKTFVCKREREKLLFKKINAYGFNEYLMRNAKSFTKILLTDDYYEYEFPLDYLNIHGKNYLHFKEQGFELQLFLPLEYLEKYRKNVGIDLI